MWAYIVPDQIVCFIPKLFRVALSMSVVVIYYYWDICLLKELIMDHESEFVAHRINKDGSWDSEFKRRIGENTY